MPRRKKAPEPARVCMNCKHGLNIGGGSLHCHRRSPTIATILLSTDPMPDHEQCYAVWPRVLPDLTCGDFEHKEPE